MRIGRGLLDLVVKSDRRGVHHAHWPSFHAAIPAALMLSVILVGCGNISLGALLEKQVLGELAITPQTATISPGSSIEINGKGGFTPYTFSATAGSFDEIDGVTYYTAPGSAAPAVTITVADRFSSKATATIEVVGSGGLSFPDAMTINIGENTGYVVVSGGTEPYSFWLEGDGWLEFHDLLEDRVKYHADVPSATTAYVWVEDSSSPANQEVLTVTVVE